MKNLLLLLLCAHSVFSQTPKQPQTSLTSESLLDRASTYFHKATEYTFDENYSPGDYVGSLIYYEKDKPKEVNVLNLTKPLKLYISQKMINKEMLHDMVSDKNKIALGLGDIFSGEIGKDNLVEVVMTNEYSLECENFDITPFNYKILKGFYDSNKDKYVIKLVYKVEVSSVVARQYVLDKKKAGFNYILAASSENYVETKSVRKKNIVSMASNDLSKLLTIYESANEFNKSSGMIGVDKNIGSNNGWMYASKSMSDDVLRTNSSSNSPEIFQAFKYSLPTEVKTEPVQLDQVIMSTLKL